jgi:5-keto 4-deoxyuronate isomerase
MKTILLIMGCTLLLMSCNSNPKTIEADESSPATAQAETESNEMKLHKVVVNEVLNTSRYSYLNVTEDENDFWIAIPKKEVEKGGTYYYRGGLKKTNFKSIEHDRVFETLYLVSDISTDPGMSGYAGGNPHANIKVAATEDNQKVSPPPGGITIAELFKNKTKYEGQTVRVKGRCIKLNNMIMNRNWVHLQDGSSSKNEQDLTVTTTDNVMLGDVVAFEGKISLNKDFGAGYKYEIIMEEAHLLQ